MRTATESLDLPSPRFEEIEQRAHVYPLPPSGFDPLSATNAQLDHHGLPARPDQTRDPELFCYWNWLLGKPFDPVVPEFVKPVGIFEAQVPSHQVGRGSRQVARHQIGRGSQAGSHGVENSSNWSGSYLAAPAQNRFVQVVGTWQVPRPSLPSVPPEGAGSGNESYQSSIWIGIDGHRCYPYSSLPQIGTSQVITVRGGVETVTTYAWWQWWSKDGNFPPGDRNNPPVRITNFRLSVGDEISAELTVQSADEVRFQIKNQTTGQFTTFLAVAPGPILSLGSTVEWIMERPTILGERRMYPLPNYGDVVFRNCFARSVAPVGGQTMVNRLDRARLIRMFERFPNPHRVSFVSLPQKQSSTSVRVFYRDASASGSGGLLA